ncbi:aromatic-ring hydroxylase C-terminal domain-containing protein [Nonomuraea recticatena]
MPYDLLDTYDAERRLAGAHTLAHTRAQAALEGLTGENGDALRELLTELFAYEGPARHLGQLLQGSDIRYGAAAGHALVGRFAPDLPLTTAAGPTRVAELMRGGRPVLLDLGGGGLKGAGWVDVVRAHTDDPPADALLIRPDGYIAWAGAGDLPEVWLAS